jgi:hypothetical protein
VHQAQNSAVGERSARGQLTAETSSLRSLRLSMESTRWCCNNGGTQGYKHAQAAVELLSPRGFRAVGDREDEGTVERSPPARSVDIRSKVGEKKEEGADRADSPGPHVRERGYPLS